MFLPPGEEENRPAVQPYRRGSIRDRLLGGRMALRMTLRTRLSALRVGAGKAAM